MARLTTFAVTALLLAAAACGDKGASTTAATTSTATTSTATTSTATTSTAANAATLPGKPVRDWTQVVVATPEGGFRMGNPDAKVKFLEFASLTCPHCRDFNKESMAGIRSYVATGKVSYEFRNFILNGYDLAVSVAARCQAPAAFFRSVDSLYATQVDWMQNYIKLTPEQLKAIQAEPREQQLVTIADKGKMDEFFRLRGMPRAKYEACLTDEKNVQKLQAIAEDAQKTYHLEGTPTFVLNGETKQDLHIWPDVDKAIKAMLG